MLKRIQLFVCILGFLGFAGCESSEVAVVESSSVPSPDAGGEVVVNPEPEPETLQNLVATIRAQTNFQYFSDALEFTQLDLLFVDERLAYTITVPTDMAFNALSEEKRTELLSSPESMRQLLLRHVSETVESSADLEVSGTTMLDGSLRVFSSSQFVNRDIDASNGIVHGINIVFEAPSMDPDGPTVLQTLSGDSQFSGLVAALQSTPVAATLSDQSQNLTFFAPTNSAFIQLGEAAVIALYANRTLLTDLLQYHLVTSSILESVDFGAGLPVLMPVANGGMLTLLNAGGVLRVDNVAIQPVPIAASNGIIYVIETVLDPNEL